MEWFPIKREPYLSREIEESIDNHSLIIDEKPNNIKLECNGNYTIGSIPICSENYFEIKQELDFSYEDQPMHEVENVDIEEIDDINNSLIHEIPNNIKIENIQDQNTSTITICSGKHYDIKQELDCSHEDHSISNVNNASSDDLLTKLKNAIVVLERLTIVQILEYTKKTETDSDHITLNVDALKYVCMYSCSECDSTVDAESIQNIINHPPECECVPTMAYQCMRCNRHCFSFLTIQKHVNTEGLCKSRKRFLHLEGLNDDEWKNLNCPKCKVSLENLSQFEKHVNDCEELPKFWCSLCDYGSARINNFRSHLKVHASQRTQSKTGFSAEEVMQNACDRKEKKDLLKTTACYCSTCDKTLVTKRFKLPSVTCNKCGTPYTYRCPTCKTDYLTQASLRHHIESTCNTSKDYRCCVCKQKEFAILYALKSHMSHCGKTQYLHCKFCSFKTKHSRVLLRHLKRHFKNDRTFINQDQDEGTIYAGRLYNIFCEQCNEPRENGEYRNDSYHCLKCSRQLLLQCRKCNQEFKRYRSISDHIESNCGREMNGKLQKCSKCNQTIKNLNLHIGYCRDLTKYCAHCSYSTKFKCDLTRHLFAKHHREF